MSRSPRAHRCLRALLACFLACGIADVRGDEEAPRRLLSGTIDSRVDLWEAGRRLPLPGIVISSETYLLLSPSLTPEEAPVFTVHRAELTGEPTGERREALRRIALTGVIASYEQEVAVRPVGDDPQAAAAPIMEATPDGGFVVASPLLPGSAPDRAGRPRPAAVRDAEFLQRYALAGVISSDDDRIVAVTEPVSDPAEPRPRSAQSRVRDTADAVLARLVDSLTSPNVTTLVRADSAEFDDGRSEGTVLAMAQARFRTELRRPRWSARLGYDLDAADYLDGGLEGFVNHSFTTDYDFRVGPAESISATYRRRSLRDQRDSQAIDDFQATVSGPYAQTTESLGLRWRDGPDQGRFGHTLGLSRDRTIVRFADGDGFEQAVNFVTGSVLYRLNRRVTLLVDGEYQSLAYAERSDSTQFRVRGGAQLRLSRRLNGSGTIGVQQKRFEDGTPRDEIVNLDANLDWRASRRDTVSLVLSRGFAEIFDRGAGDIAPNAFAVRSAAIIDWERKWTPRWSTESSLGYRHQDPRNANARTEDWQLQTTGRYAISRDVRVSAAAAYTRSRDAVRGDFERWTFTLSLDLPGRRSGRGRRGS